MSKVTRASLTVGWVFLPWCSPCLWVLGEEPTSCQLRWLYPYLPWPQAILLQCLGPCAMPENSHSYWLSYFLHVALALQHNAELMC